MKNYSVTIRKQFIKTDQILNSVKFVADLVIKNCKVEPFSEIRIVLNHISTENHLLSTKFLLSSLST